MYEKNLIKKIEQEARSYFKDALPTHDWSHVERVGILADCIGQEEGANLTIVRLATLLHDIGRREEDKRNGKNMSCKRKCKAS